MRLLVSVPQILDVMGGQKGIAKYMRVSTAVVSNWKATGKFPAATYVALQQRLDKLGYTAPDKLWTMRKPRRKAKR